MVLPGFLAGISGHSMRALDPSFALTYAGPPRNTRRYEGMRGSFQR